MNRLNMFRLVLANITDRTELSLLRVSNHELLSIDSVDHNIHISRLKHSAGIKGYASNHI